MRRQFWHTKASTKISLWRQMPASKDREQFSPRTKRKEYYTWLLWKPSPLSSREERWYYEVRNSSAITHVWKHSNHHQDHSAIKVVLEALNPSSVERPFQIVGVNIMDFPNTDKGLNMSLLSGTSSPSGHYSPPSQIRRSRGL